MAQRVEVESIVDCLPRCSLEFCGVGFFNVHLFDFSAIIEIIIGLLTVTFGVTLLFYREDRNDYSRSGFVGIVGGTLIFVAGGAGIVLYKDPQNYSKNLSRMAFSILACCVSVVGIGFFSEGVM